MACLGNGGCLQALVDRRTAAVQNAAEFASSPIGTGLVEIAAAGLTSGATLEATSVWKAATGIVAAAGLWARGSTRIIGATTNQNPAQVERGMTGVSAVTSPAGPNSRSLLLRTSNFFLTVSISAVAHAQDLHKSTVIAVTDSIVAHA